MLSPREKKEAKDYLRSEVSLMEDSMAGVEKENIAAASTPLTMDSASNMMPGCDLLFDLIQEGEVGNPRSTCVLKQAFNADIEKLEKDTSAYVERVKAGKVTEKEEDIIEYWNKIR